MLKKLSVIATILVMSAVCLAQREAPSKEKKEASAATEQQTYRSSPAYAEILLRKTELTSNLESLILDYTEEFPKVKELRQSIVLLDRESARLSRVKPNELGKLTLALGKLIVRKVELEVDVLNLQRTYKDEHPDVKRAVRKVEIYESAIAEILN
jgi:hypothetical protein